MSRRVLFIVNPQAAAGRAGRLWPTFLARLPKDRLVVDCLSTTAPGHALALAGDAAERYDVVAAAGGDGTVNEVASGLLLAERGRALLGIVPLGTGNDAACQAGLRGLDQALAALTDGVPRAVDAVEVDYVAAGQKARHYALLFAAVGFAGELIKRTTPRVKRWFGPRLCYTVGFLRALWGYRAPVMRVRADAQELRGRMFHVCAGNAERGGGGVMRLSPHARWDDGELDLCVIEALGRFETLRYFPLLLRGAHVGHPKVRFFRGAVLSVDSDPPMELQLDGDLVGSTPATFRLRPGALRVLSL